MGLEAKPPARVIETIGNGRGRIRGKVIAVHRLQPKMREGEVAQAIRRQALLRKNKLQLGTRIRNKRRPRLGADAKPVEAMRRSERAVGFDGGVKTSRMDRADQRRVELQQRFAAGENHEAVRLAARPYVLDRRGKVFRVGKAAASRAIHADKIRIAEAADRAAPVIFLARPEIAARKAAEYGGAARVRALALQSEKYFLHRIFAHAFVPMPMRISSARTSRDPTRAFSQSARWTKPVKGWHSRVKPALGIPIGVGR
jgi:hypothetical protein